MPRRRFPIALGPALLLAVLPSLSGLLVQESELERTHAAADRIVDRGGYQRELPGFAESENSGSSTSRRASESGPREREGRVRRDDGERRSVGSAGSPSGSGDGGGLAGLAFPLEIAAGVLFVLLAIWVVLVRRGAARIATSTNVKPVALAAPSVAAADPISTLIASGRFAEAIHQLLLAALDQVARAFRLRVARGTTSREIVPRVPVEPGRDALRELVLLDERGRFAARPVDATDVERGRELARATAASAPEPPA